MGPGHINRALNTTHSNARQARSLFARKVMQRGAYEGLHLPYLAPFLRYSLERGKVARPGPATATRWCWWRASSIRSCIAEPAIRRPAGRRSAAPPAGRLTRRDRPAGAASCAEPGRGAARAPTKETKGAEMTPEQLDGFACIVCGRSDRPMVPIYVETPTSTMVFRCSSCDCPGGDINPACLSGNEGMRVVLVTAGMIATMSNGGGPRAKSRQTATTTQSRRSLMNRARR